jgi:hypothetical protein
MSADLDALVALMPFAGKLGLVLDEAGADRVVARLDWALQLCRTAGERLVAQTTQVQAVR